jgi:hypothetical protein
VSSGPLWLVAQPALGGMEIASPPIHVEVMAGGTGQPRVRASRTVTGETVVSIKSGFLLSCHKSTLETFRATRPITEIDRSNGRSGRRWSD